MRRPIRPWNHQSFNEDHDVSQQIRFTGFRDRPTPERQIRFQTGCRTEGRTEVAFVASGTNLQLTFNLHMGPYGHDQDCDFDKEQGKVSNGRR